MLILWGRKNPARGPNGFALDQAPLAPNSNDRALNLGVCIWDHHSVFHLPSIQVLLDMEHHAQANTVNA